MASMASLRKLLSRTYDSYLWIQNSCNNWKTHTRTVANVHLKLHICNFCGFCYAGKAHLKSVLTRLNVKGTFDSYKFWE